MVSTRDLQFFCILSSVEKSNVSEEKHRNSNVSVEKVEIRVEQAL